MAAGNAELVRSSFDAFLRGDWDAIAQAMDPDAEWLWYEPGDWDCHERCSPVQRRLVADQRRVRPVEGRPPAAGARRADHPSAGRRARPRRPRPRPAQGHAGADQEELDNARWCAAHGGRRETAEVLLDRGTSPRWVGHDDLDAAAAADRSEAHELAAWLRGRAEPQTAQPQVPST